MPCSTKSGFDYVILKICGSLFRQVLFVLERVPDVLDVIVILEGIQQLAHQLELIGVGQTGGGHGDHGQVVGEDLVALLLHCLDDSGVVLGVGGDLSGLFACIEVLSTGIQSVAISTASAATTTRIATVLLSVRLYLLLYRSRLRSVASCSAVGRSTGLLVRFPMISLFLL